jgi:Lar family restriction alleviation protein
MKKPQILPCPFCGLEVTDLVQVDEYSYKLQCVGCYANGPIADAEKAVKAWNRRETRNSQPTTCYPKLTKLDRLFNRIYWLLFK